MNRNNMLGFIVPFKPYSASRNWILDNKLLINTINSILNQDDKNFKIYIIYTDEPIHKLTNENILYVKFDKYLAELKDIEDIHVVSKFHGDGKILNRFDKERKICLGISKAKEDRCKYIMSVDADDLVSCKIVSFVTQNNENSMVPGWYVEKGYLYTYGNKYVLDQFVNMWALNGSTHIVRIDFLPNPNPDSMKYEDFSFFTSHGYIRNRVKLKYGVELLPIPFPAIIYVAHTSNLSQIGTILNLKTGNILKKIIKIIVRYRKINKKISEEFLISRI